MIYAENKKDTSDRIQADEERGAKIEITEKDMLPDLITGCLDQICKAKSMVEVLDAALTSDESIVEQSKVVMYLRAMSDILDDAEKDLSRAERAAMK